MLPSVAMVVVGSEPASVMAQEPQSWRRFTVDSGPLRSTTLHCVLGLVVWTLAEQSGALVLRGPVCLALGVERGGGVREPIEDRRGKHVVLKISPRRGGSYSW